MCRNTKTLYNFDPPATEKEIHAASIQFIRKVSGSTKPSKANEVIFENAVRDVAAVVAELLDSLVTSAEPKNRELEAAKARARLKQRIAKGQLPT